MIIATRNVDIDKCFELSKDADKLEEYIMSLIPDKYQHLNSIISNQKYYINCKMFDSKVYSLDIKRELSSVLMSNVRVVGMLDTFITMREIESVVDMKAVKNYRKDTKQ